MHGDLLSILRKISEIIAGSDAYETVLDKIVDELAASLDVEACSIYVHKQESDLLELAATCGLNKSAVGQVAMKPGEGLTGSSFKEKNIFNLSEPEKHPKFKYFQNTGEERFKTFFSVPLTARGRCVGILTFQSVRPDKFPNSVVDMVKTLSTQLANLILNARMLHLLSEDGRNDTAATTEQRTKVGQTMLRGIAANDGIAVGRTFFFQSRRNFDIFPHATTSVTNEDLALFEAAVDVTKRQIVELEKRALDFMSEIDASIFNVHLLLLDDKSLLEEIRQDIVREGHTAEFSVRCVYEKYRERFLKMKDPIFREKEMDIRDVLLRLAETIRNLRTGGEERAPEGGEMFPDQLILVAEELLPSDLIRMPIERIAGIVCEKGGVTAHVAILAKALDIPALMGVRGTLARLNGGDEAILDGHGEVLHIRPDEETLCHYRNAIEGEKAADDEGAPPLPSVTPDGCEIVLRANVSLVCEMSQLRRFGARGIGLYRTEFLYMIRDSLPSEETQYQLFSKILQESSDEDVAIRVLDSGGDKPLPYLNFPREDNPSLGNRGIRFLIGRSDILKPHLRALLRAGVHGRLKTLFPMVSCIQEIYQIRQVLSEVETELHANGIEHSECYQLGIMVEIPSILFCLEKVLCEVDWISVGSNDLLQYAFAVDRGNEQVSRIYQPLQPVFLSMLKEIGAVMRRHPKKGFSLCGEMAGNPLCAPLLVGAGIHELSMAPRLIPAIRRTIRAFSLRECEALLDEAIGMDNPESVQYLIKEQMNEKKLGDIFHG